MNTKKPKYVDRYGNPLKLPKTLREYYDKLRDAADSNKRHVQDEVLYLQGKQKTRHSSENMSPLEQHRADIEAAITGQFRPASVASIFSGLSNGATQQPNPRQDIVSALAEIGQANAKIAYSLMKALEVGK